MSSEDREGRTRAKAVAERSTRVAKRVARWQRRLWLFESVIGPLLAVTLAAGLAMVGWRLIRGRQGAGVRPPNIAAVPPSGGPGNGSRAAEAGADDSGAAAPVLDAVVVRSESVIDTP